MTNKAKKIIYKICFIVGASILVAAITVLVVWQCSISINAKKSQKYLETLGLIMPETKGAALEERADNTMSVLSVDDKDFIGIIEMPRFSSKLPVGASWGESSKHPCLFGGSLYDRTIKIGATTQKGQYSFCREISVGDTLIFTDVQGNRYTYAIADLRYRQHADNETLNQIPADLVLFVKNIYDFEYLIISCNITK